MTIQLYKLQIFNLQITNANSFILIYSLQSEVKRVLKDMNFEFYSYKNYFLSFLDFFSAAIINCHKILETEQNHKIKDHFLSQVMWSRMIPNLVLCGHYFKYLCRSTFCQPNGLTDYVTSGDRDFRCAKTKL